MSEIGRYAKLCITAISGNSNSLTYGSYKSESCPSTSIGCGEFTNRINRELWFTASTGLARPYSSISTQLSAPQINPHNATTKTT
jgi:hypothetical protein